jgi:hypothetical protein
MLRDRMGGYKREKKELNLYYKLKVRSVMTERTK